MESAELPEEIPVPAGMKSDCNPQIGRSSPVFLKSVQIAILTLRSVYFRRYETMFLMLPDASEDEL
eukprot:4325158-Pyramimonas_sp.AAC.1